MCAHRAGWASGHQCKMVMAVFVETHRELMWKQINERDGNV